MAGGIVHMTLWTDGLNKQTGLAVQPEKKTGAAVMSFL